jgi:hypothetical protein
MKRAHRFGISAPAILLGSGLALGSVGPALAGLWQWTDGAGGVHKSRSLDDVPEAFRGSATEIPESGPVSKPAATQPAPPRRAVPPAATQSTSTTTSTEPEPDAATDKDGHDRAWWQAQVIEARKAVNDLEAKIEHLKSEGVRSPIVRKEREAKKELATADSDLKKARAHLEVELPAAAAEAGAPASWLRVK